MMMSNRSPFQLKKDTVRNDVHKDSMVDTVCVSAYQKAVETFGYGSPEANAAWEDYAI